VIATGGCVDGFRGANVQIDLSAATPVQAPVMGMGGPTDLPASSHLTLFAIQQDPAQDRLFEVERFEIHRIVDPSSPCFIDVGEHVAHPGLHVTQYAKRIEEDTKILDPANPPATATEQQKVLVATALQRIVNVNALAGPTGIKVVTSASTAVYPTMAAACDGPADQIPPPTCFDDPSNARRLKLCQAAWKADPNLFEGTDLVLTAPLNGFTRGFVDGDNPITQGVKVGGAQFFVDEALDNIDAYAIYTQEDRPPPEVPPPPVQLLFGRPTMPTRGVLHVHLVSPGTPGLTAEMAIFVDLGQDDVHF
jgi:hypothetical protein